MAEAEFQDRCLKPLGHPSLSNVKHLHAAANKTNVDTATPIATAAIRSVGAPYLDIAEMSQ
jgi:hypothetical protein